METILSRTWSSTWISASSVIFEGNTDFDAWLIAATVQIGPVLLTLPSSFAQLGMYRGIALMILYGCIGCWSNYVVTALYADYCRIKAVDPLLIGQPFYFTYHTVQWYEVLRELLGKRWMAFALIFNTLYLSCLGVINIIASGSIVYYINNDLPKRTWTIIFGVLFLPTIIIPSAHSYRLLCLLGIITTTYTASYLTVAAIIHGQKETPEIDDIMTHQLSLHGANNLENIINGATNILYTFGSHGFTVEILHSMWHPEKYKIVYVYAIMYILSLTISSASFMYWAFGDELLNNFNAFSFMPKTKFRDAAIVAMLIHQFTQYSFASLPINILLEKLFGVHHSKHFIKRIIARVPFVLMAWIVSLMFPFFGLLNHVVGSLLVTGAVYIIPCLSHVAYYWRSQNQENATTKPHPWIGSWRVMFLIDIFVIFWITCIGVGFGSWASVKSIVQQVQKFGFFAKCFDC